MPEADDAGNAAAAISPDPARCPLCGAPNRCAMAAGSASRCWCVDVEITAGVLAALADSARGRACLCPRCAQGSTPR